MQPEENNHDIERLVLEIEKNRIQMQIASRKAENLEAALQSAKEAENKAKPLQSDGKPKNPKE